MKGDNIATRLLDFAVASLRLASVFPNTLTGQHVASQLIRSATAPGAHYEEARGAESPADFVHKLRLATKELRESIYWLNVASKAQFVPPEKNVLGIINEANELVAILTASAKTAQAKGKRQR
jgi:four helix bundle protein